MYHDASDVIEDSRHSKLLASFNKLEECDKDVIVLMSEALLEKYKANIINNAVE